MKKSDFANEMEKAELIMDYKEKAKDRLKKAG